MPKHKDKGLDTTQPPTNCVFDVTVNAPDLDVDCLVGTSPV